jgi:hypothetical protein
MPKPLRHTGGIFKEIHDQLMDCSIDFSSLSAGDFAPDLVDLARAVWQERVQTEFRSIQIMARFVTEVVAAGDPLEVYAGAVDLVADEVRHTALCAALCEALGASVELPDPVEQKVSEGFAQSPAGARSLNTAISMLLINETISVGFIRDLHARCEQPVVRALLAATVEDEEGHEKWGWAYVEKSLQRFPDSTLPDWRKLVTATISPHRESADRIIAEIPSDQRRLDAWPDTAEVALGLFTPQRQALVFEQTYQDRLVPGLSRLRLL